MRGARLFSNDDSSLVDVEIDEGKFLVVALSGDNHPETREVLDANGAGRHATSASQ